jgi:TPR repeat protein
MTRSFWCSLFALFTASAGLGLVHDAYAAQAAERRKSSAARDAPAGAPPEAQTASRADAPPAPDTEKLRALLEGGNFAELDAALAVYQEAYRKGVIGDEEAAQPFIVLTRPDPDLKANYDKWIADKPNSYVARVARGYYLARLGYFARGTASAAKTTRVQFSDMNSLFWAAMEDLRISLRLDPKPVLSGGTLIWIGQGIGAREQMTSIVNDVIALDRHVYTARASYLAGLRPEWGGSLEEMERVIEGWRRLLEPRQIARFERMVEDAKWRTALAPAENLYRAKQYKEAAEHYTRALEKAPVARAFAMRGAAYAELGQHDKAIEDFNRALELDPDGECCSGTRSSRGRSYLRSGAADKALADFLVAAENEDAFAMRELALMYAFGRHGTKKDYVAGRRWCERSAKQGDGLSMYCIGSIHHAGLGVPKDPAKAAKWFEGAAKRGIPDAQADYAFMLWNGQGAPQDRGQAVTWWRAAAKQGNARAKSQLEGNLSGWEYFTQVTWPEWRESWGI